MWLVEDEVSKNLPIPNHYGVDDFPVIIQDKRLDNFGTPEYSEPGSGGFVGDTLLVNGVQSPYVEVSRGWVRLRLLKRFQLPALSAADERWPTAACDFRRSGVSAGAGFAQAAIAGPGGAA
ncbi:cell division protein [Klebsiella pneumoniae subsp. rhinoscleromatis]|nr:cell division protein [Klebsiella pneumoniae subsp. rhinoscleromatis]